MIYYYYLLIFNIEININILYSQDYFILNLIFAYFAI